MDIGSGQHRRRIDILSLAKSLGKELCSALQGLHVNTGEDCCAAFRGKAKLPALKLMQKHPEYIQAFAKIGDDWKISDVTSEVIEKFTCGLYGCHRCEKVNDARGFKLKSMCGSKGKITKKCKLDLYKLPPCYNSFKPHLLRANYQARRLKLSDSTCPEIPQPQEGHGWVCIDDKTVEPQWTDGPILPDNLVDLLEETDLNSDSDSSSENGDDSEDSGANTDND